MLALVRSRCDFAANRTPNGMYSVVARINMVLRVGFLSIFYHNVWEVQPASWRIAVRRLDRLTCISSTFAGMQKWIGTPCSVVCPTLQLQRDISVPLHTSAPF